MTYRRRGRRNGSALVMTVTAFSLGTIGATALLVAAFLLVAPHRASTQPLLHRFDHVVSLVTAHTAEAVPLLPSPTFTVVVTTPVPLAAIPSPQPVAQAYLKDWATGHYRQMYQLLSSQAQAAHSESWFTDWYRQVTQTATITKIQTTILSTPTVPKGAGDGASLQVPVQVVFHTILVGSFTEENSVPVVIQKGQWRVDWSPSLYFNGLGAQDAVRMFPLNPTRGSILDRKGRPLAMTGYEVTIGVVPGQLAKGGKEAQTLQIIGQYLHQTPAQLQKIFANQPAGWFIPLGNVPASQEAQVDKQLNPLPGVLLRHTPIRTYPQGTVASHVVGYVSHITPQELKQLAPEGYTADDIVGRAGVESWANSQLAGRKGGILAIVGSDGSVISIIARRNAVAGDNVVLSIDLDIQKEAETVLHNLAGSVVVLDPRTNAVLAMASYPNFDPNQFVTGLTPQQWQALSTNPNQPFLDRPVQAAFATGSIFKPITMTAGMGALGIQPSRIFDCNYWWNGPGGLHLHNWRVEGNLNLIQSITGSCDPTFYQIGLELWQRNPSILSQYATEFGLGQKTGINGVSEISGLVPSPAWKAATYHQPWYAGDSVELAIGQSYLQATPMQMANMYSAFAANGLRRSPLLVQKIVTPQGQVVQTFTAKTLGHLPASPATLAAIKQGMLGTTSTPLGTAYYAFSTYKHPMEVKTGSASNQGPLAHAWFVGYSPPDNPQYVVLVMIEGRGESMQIASPMARQLMDYLWPNNDPQPPPR